LSTRRQRSDSPGAATELDVGTTPSQAGERTTSRGAVMMRGHLLQEQRRVFFKTSLQNGFHHAMSVCGMQALGERTGIKRCLLEGDKDGETLYPESVRKDPLFKQIAGCMGIYGECSRDNCAWPCGLGYKSDSDDCHECVYNACVPDLAACAGVPEADVPHF